MICHNWHIRKRPVDCCEADQEEAQLVGQRDLRQARHYEEMLIASLATWASCLLDDWETGEMVMSVNARLSRVVWPFGTHP